MNPDCAINPFRVIDQKRNMAWDNPYQAMLWYRAELDKAEASIRSAVDLICMNIDIEYQQAKA